MPYSVAMHTQEKLKFIQTQEIPRSIINSRHPMEATRMSSHHKYTDEQNKVWCDYTVEYYSDTEKE